jgi:hypothetical protein
MISSSTSPSGEHSRVLEKMVIVLHNGLSDAKLIRYGKLTCFSCQYLFVMATLYMFVSFGSGGTLFG